MDERGSIPLLLDSDHPRHRPASPLTGLPVFLVVWIAQHAAVAPFGQCAELMEGGAQAREQALLQHLERCPRILLREIPQQPQSRGQLRRTCGPMGPIVGSTQVKHIA